MKSYSLTNPVGNGVGALVPAPAAIFAPGLRIAATADDRFDCLGRTRKLSRPG